MTPEGYLAVRRARNLYPIGIIADALAALEAEIVRLERALEEAPGDCREEEAYEAGYRDGWVDGQAQENVPDEGPA